VQRNPLVIFGEVLFDSFPDGRQVLGGAPFNLAWHLQAFGAAPQFISAVGEDADGARIRTQMAGWGMDLNSLQVDPKHPTGRVSVQLIDGEPSFDILPEVAYDHIRAAPESAAGGLLYHGTLALRQPVSAASLRELKAGRPDLIFLDVNLRDPWWSRTETLELLQDADWVKLNHVELQRLDDNAATLRPLHEQARDFLSRHHLTGLIVTLGEDGALGLTADAEPVTVTPQPTTEVLDTVGAGDAFAAVTILGIRNDWPLALTLERAQSFASRIVEQRGATAVNPGLYQSFIDHWGLID
jgi:fructokinase